MVIQFHSSWFESFVFLFLSYLCLFLSFHGAATLRRLADRENAARVVFDEPIVLAVYLIPAGGFCCVLFPATDVWQQFYSSSPTYSVPCMSLLQRVRWLSTLWCAVEFAVGDCDGCWSCASRWMSWFSCLLAVAASSFVLLGLQDRPGTSSSWSSFGSRNCSWYSCSRSSVVCWTCIASLRCSAWLGGSSLSHLASSTSSGPCTSRRNQSAERLCGGFFFFFPLSPFPLLLRVSQMLPRSHLVL